MSHLFALQLPAQKIEDLAGLASLLRNLATSRRGLMLAPFVAALPASFVSDPAQAIDPNETQVTLPDQFQWKPALPSAPAQSVESVPVFGATDKPGPYVALIKWYPGYMSAPRRVSTHDFGHLGPCPHLPYAKILVPKRRTRAEPRGISQKQSGEGIERSATSHVGLDPKHRRVDSHLLTVMPRPFLGSSHANSACSDITTDRKSYKSQFV